ncbi:MAG TPA: hypothetical protein VL992_04625, partial [Tepidisphaeraceae bacterium]|nr:hypothetical protein [Tepidisphaeraceae bacterium]
IAGLRRQETAFQNIYIKDFDTTVDRLPRGQTQWTSTHWRYRGSAWYDGDPRGKVRIYFTDLIEPWQMDDRSPVSWIEIMRDMSWDGVEGRELRVADSSMRGGMMRTRIASIQDQPPMMFDRFTRWATGVGFSLQYLVTQNDDTYPPRPHVKLSQIFQSALPYANRGGWTISRETVNGFDAVRVRFGGVKGSSITYWFDPSRGFAIVKYQEVLDFRALRPDGGGYVRTQGFDVQQLQELRPGVWFPMQATEITEAGEGSYQRYNFQAADAVADDPKLDPKIFTAPIPTGWMVTETRGGLTRSYVTMDGGAEQEIHEGEPMPRVKAGIAENPDGNTPAVATQGRAVW